MERPERPEELRRQIMKDELLKDIRKHPGTWVEDIARRLKWNRQTVSNYVKTLRADGVVRLERKGAMDLIYPNDGR